MFVLIRQDEAVHLVIGWFRFPRRRLGVPSVILEVQADEIQKRVVHRVGLVDLLQELPGLVSLPIEIFDDYPPSALRLVVRVSTQILQGDSISVRTLLTQHLARIGFPDARYLIFPWHVLRFFGEVDVLLQNDLSNHVLVLPRSSKGIHVFQC